MSSLFVGFSFCITNSKNQPFMTKSIPVQVNRKIIHPSYYEIFFGKQTHIHDKDN